MPQDEQRLLAALDSAWTNMQDSYLYFEGKTPEDHTYEDALRELIAQSRVHWELLEDLERARERAKRITHD